MATMIVSIPFGNSDSKEIVGRKDVEGEVVGPFIVHPCIDHRGGWTVSHVKTTFAAQAALPTKKRAMWLAKELSKLDCWDFESWQDAKKIPKETMALVNTLRADAMHGDMQGAA